MIWNIRFGKKDLPKVAVVTALGIAFATKGPEPLVTIFGLVILGLAGLSLLTLSTPNTVRRQND